MTMRFEPWMETMRAIELGVQQWLISRLIEPFLLASTTHSSST